MFMDVSIVIANVINIYVLSLSVVIIKGLLFGNCLGLVVLVFF
jgi:hypothetical protein